MIDPDQDPERAQRYGVTAYGTVVVLASPAPGQAAHAGPPVRVEADPKTLVLSEEKLTNALLKVARGGTKTLYFLEGHGEPDIDYPQANGFSGIRHTLDGQSFLVKRLNLAHEKDVPGDCSVLIIAHPRISPLPAEIAAVDRYLQHGGKAMVMVDPAPGDRLQPFLDHWGVRVHR